MHKQGLMHRDIKPENILQVGDKWCLADFGHSVRSSTSRKSRGVGTVQYMAPEQAYDKPHDKSVDIWCLGVLLYELITGIELFPGKSK